jgi:hypothetical protein
VAPNLLISPGSAHEFVHAGSWVAPIAGYEVLMQKKYIMVVAVAVVLWCAFMGYRHHKGKRDTGAYTQEANNRATEIAKASPRAGLAQMGTALKRYHDENHAYPSNLTELFPKYLDNKPLIEEIDWYYEPRGDDFFLSKTLVLGDKRIVASIDKRLRPQAETGAMVATPTPIPKPREVEKPEEVIPQRPEPSTPERLALAREAFFEALRQRQMDVTSVSSLEGSESRVISTVQPEWVSMTDSEIGSGVGSELSERYLVWKDKNSVLGFSNVQYPHADQLSIYAIGNWYNVKMPSPKDQEPIALETKIATRKKDPDAIVSSLEGRCLVWKDEQGTLGFGNIQYPEKEPVSVLEADSWIKVQRPRLAADTGRDEDLGLQKHKSQPEIASAFSARYLVWKDRHGNLGFGNVQYPEKEPVSVFQTDTWIKAQRSLSAADTGRDEDLGLQKCKSQLEIASDLSTRHLVWKDERGTLGFGNVQYPEGNTVSVFQSKSWTRMDKASVPTQTGTDENHGLQKRKPQPKIASAFSTRYLVWKDKNGKLGFGNVQYPENGDASHIHVNGSWEPAIN